MPNKYCFSLFFQIYSHTKSRNWVRKKRGKNCISKTLDKEIKNIPGIHAIIYIVILSMEKERGEKNIFDVTKKNDTKSMFAWTSVTNKQFLGYIYEEKNVLIFKKVRGEGETWKNSGKKKITNNVKGYKDHDKHFLFSSSSLSWFNWCIVWYTTEALISP